MMLLRTVCGCLAIKLTYTHSKSDQARHINTGAEAWVLASRRLCLSIWPVRHEPFREPTGQLCLHSMPAACRCSHLGIWVADLVPLVQNGIAPGDRQELVSLQAKLLVAGDEHACGGLGY